MKAISANSCAIMQPTFLPWLGYFNLINSVDTFIFLDDVQLDKRSWQTRNRLFTGHKVDWVTCPIKKTSQNTRIVDVLITDDGKWKEKLIKTLNHSYRKAPCHKDFVEVLGIIDDAPMDKLANFNQFFVTVLCRRLGITTPFVSAFELGCDGSKSAHLLNICRAVNANHYHSPEGARHYIEDENILGRELDILTFQQFTPQPYPQIHSKEFVSHLSIIDAIANIGLKGTMDHIAGLK